MHVVIVACNYPLPAYMLLLLHALIPCVAAYYTALVSLLFGTVIPTSFNILNEMFLHLFKYAFHYISCFMIHQNSCALYPVNYCIYFLLHMFAYTCSSTAHGFFWQRRNNNDMWEAVRKTSYYKMLEDVYSITTSHDDVILPHHKL